MRILQYLFTVIILLSLNFFLPRMMPGDPLAYLVGDPAADAPMLLTEEMRANLLAYYNLDEPLEQQYLTYLRSILHGDLGWSIYYNAPVSAVLIGRLKWTLFLGGAAALIYITLGILLGAISAWRRGAASDTGLLVAVFALGSWPPFFLAMMLLLLLGVRLGLFPIGGARAVQATPQTGLGGVWDVLYHAALPGLALVLTNLPGVYLLTRNAMLTILGQGYIRTARAKGAPEWRILFHHGLPNALPPVVAGLGMRLGHIVMGSIFVEVVFAYPGMGTLLAEASAARDYPLLQGAFLVVTGCVLLFNLVADLLHGVLDPRRRWA